MAVAKSAVNAFLDRKLNSYQWLKKVKRLDLLHELRELKVRPKFKTEPWLHQLVCFYIGLCEPRFLFLLDMGLGKSWIIQNLITQAYREGKLSKALILVPRLINVGSWGEDLQKHSDLQATLIDVEDIEEKWNLLRSERNQVTVIDYQSFQWAVCRKAGKRKKYLEPNPERIEHVQRLYNFVAPDEIHKLSNWESLWYDIVQQVARTADFVYGATGTLFGNDPTEVWAQFNLVDQGETFGTNIGMFRQALFTQEQHAFKGQEWHFNRRRASDLHRMLQHKSIRYDEEEVPEIDLPPRVVEQIHLLMSDEQEGHYLTVLEGFIEAVGAQDRTKIEANWALMRRIASGYLQWKDDYGLHLIRFAKNRKLDAMERLIDEAPNAKWIISHEYTETGTLITERLNALNIQHVWLYGGSKDRPGIREAFMRDPKCRILVMNSAAGGTGTDGLQEVCNHMILFETPSNPKGRKQLFKRVHRPGQHKRSFIYDLVMLHTLDQGILDKIQAGIDLYESVVNGQKVSQKLFR